MRPCRHCSHENADHLAFCSQCGAANAVRGRRSMVRGPRRRRPAPGDGDRLFTDRAGDAWAGVLTDGRPSRLAAPLGRLSGLPGRAGPRRPDRACAGWANRSATSTSTCAASWTPASAGAACSRSAPARKRCWRARSTSSGRSVLREGVQHAELTGLLEAIGRAHARREAAVADTATSESLQQAEAARLGNQQAAAEARVDRGRQRQPRVRGDPARGDGRSPDRRRRAWRASRTSAARIAARDAAGPTIGDARPAQLGARRRGSRPSSARWRSRSRASIAQLAGSARARRRAARRRRRREGEARRRSSAARRQAASAMAASIAGRLRDRGRRRARDRRADRAARPRRPPRSARRTRRCCPATRTSIA